jgi:hypothetical protein
MSATTRTIQADEAAAVKDALEAFPRAMRAFSESISPVTRAVPAAPCGTVGPLGDAVSCALCPAPGRSFRASFRTTSSGARIPAPVVRVDAPCRGASGFPSADGTGLRSVSGLRPLPKSGPLTQAGPSRAPAGAVLAAALLLASAFAAIPASAGPNAPDLNDLADLGISRGTVSDLVAESLAPRARPPMEADFVLLLARYGGDPLMRAYLDLDMESRHSPEAPLGEQAVKSMIARRDPAAEIINRIGNARRDYRSRGGRGSGGGRASRAPSAGDRPQSGARGADSSGGRAESAAAAAAGFAAGAGAGAASGGPSRAGTGFSGGGGPAAPSAGSPGREGGMNGGQSQNGGAGNGFGGEVANGDSSGGFTAQGTGRPGPETGFQAPAQGPGSGFASPAGGPQAPRPGFGASPSDQPAPQPWPDGAYKQGPVSGADESRFAYDEFRSGMAGSGSSRDAAGAMSEGGAMELGKAGSSFAEGPRRRTAETQEPAVQEGAPAAPASPGAEAAAATPQTGAVPGQTPLPGPTPQPTAQTSGRQGDDSGLYMGTYQTQTPDGHRVLVHRNSRGGGPGSPADGGR